MGLTQLAIKIMIMLSLSRFSEDSQDAVANNYLWDVFQVGQSKFISCRMVR